MFNIAAKIRFKDQSGKWKAERFLKTDHKKRKKR